MADLFAADWAKVGGAPLTIQCVDAAAPPIVTVTATPTTTVTPTPLPTVIATLTPLPTVTAILAPTVAVTAAPTITATSVRDDLTRIRCIGPTYAGRLYAPAFTSLSNWPR